MKRSALDLTYLRPAPFLWLVLLLGPAAAMSLQMSGMATPPEAGEGIVVLRTGGLLHGRITPSGQHYIVSAADREIRLLRRDVEMICRDLAEAYAKKRAALFADSSTEHIALAQWCIRHGLHESAARELLDARRLDPRHPRLAFTEQCLAMALRPTPPKKVSGTFFRNGPEGASHKRFLTPFSAVRQAASTEMPPPEETQPQAPLAAERLPAKAVESFSETIQPLLLNTCTTSGCHQVGGREVFQLDRWALGRTGDRRTTLRNLQSTLAWIDRENPRESRLLQEAGRAHGPLTVPPLAGRRAELYAKLAHWVRECSDLPDPPPTKEARNFLPERPEPEEEPLLRKKPLQRGGALRRVRNDDPTEHPHEY